MAKTKNAKNFMVNLLGGPMSFAVLVRPIRTLDDLTQKELADIFEVTFSHISDIENGRKLVSVETLHKS